MVALLPQYKLTKSRDLRSAMAEALRDYLLTISYTYPFTNQPTSLKAVFEEWAKFEQRAMTAVFNPAQPVPQPGQQPTFPAVGGYACILPDAPIEEDANFTPRLIDETWAGGAINPGDPVHGTPPTLGDGSGDGWALFEVAEKTVPFWCIARFISTSERKAFLSALEDGFIDAGVVGEVADQPRFGKIVVMPSYYNQRVRLTLVQHELLDQESSAKENRWMAQFRCLAQARHMILRRVRALDVRILTSVDGISAPR